MITDVVTLCESIKSYHKNLQKNVNRLQTVNESDPRSNFHYLGSSENKAWKKFRPVQDLNPWPLIFTTA